MRQVKLALCSLIIMVGSGCKRNEPVASPEPTAPFTIYTTFYPTSAFAQRIGGGLVQVVNPCPEDADPAFWRPSPQQIAEYQRADLIVLNGAGLEKWVAQTSLPETRVVDTTKPLSGELLRYDSAISHSHGAGGSHTHEGTDCHTWLDPVNAKVQARQIADALIRGRPAHKESFENNFKALSAELDALDGELRRLSARLGETTLLANHPAYQYVAKRYSWRLKSFDFDPASLPSPESLQRVRDYVQNAPGPRIMLWESAPEDEVARRFQTELGVANVEFSPAETLSSQDREAGADYFTIMKRNVANVLAALGS